VSVLFLQLPFFPFPFPITFWIILSLHPYLYLIPFGDFPWLIHSSATFLILLQKINPLWRGPLQISRHEWIGVWDWLILNGHALYCVDCAL
jgi:hypothetical protein